MEQAPQDIPAIDLVPMNQRINIGNANQILDFEKTSVGEKNEIILEILKGHPILPALTDSASVPEVYIYQLWNTVTLPSKTENRIRFKIDKQQVEVNLDFFRTVLRVPLRTDNQNEDFFSVPDFDNGLKKFLLDLGYENSEQHLVYFSKFERKHLPQPWNTLFGILSRSVTGKTSGLDEARLGMLQLFYGVVKLLHVDYAALIWDDICYSISSRDKKKKKKKQNPYIPFIRYFKLIIYGLMNTYPTIARRTDEMMHGDGEDQIIKRLTSFSSSNQVPGLKIPQRLLDLADKESVAYTRYVGLKVPTSQSIPAGSSQGTRKTTRKRIGRKGKKKVTDEKKKVTDEDVEVRNEGGSESNGDNVTKDEASESQIQNVRSVSQKANEPQKATTESIRPTVGDDFNAAYLETNLMDNGDFGSLNNDDNDKNTNDDVTVEIDNEMLEKAGVRSEELVENRIECTISIPPRRPPLSKDNTNLVDVNPPPTTSEDLGLPVGGEMFGLNSRDGSPGKEKLRRDSTDPGRLTSEPKPVNPEVRKALGATDEGGAPTKQTADVSLPVPVVQTPISSTTTKPSSFPTTSHPVNQPKYTTEDDVVSVVHKALAKIDEAMPKVLDNHAKGWFDRVAPDLIKTIVSEEIQSSVRQQINAAVLHVLKTEHITLHTKPSIPTFTFTEMQELMFQAMNDDPDLIQHNRDFFAALCKSLKKDKSDVLCKRRHEDPDQIPPEGENANAKKYKKVGFI
jgi:hypothetical protein